MQKYTDVVTSSRSGAAIPDASVTVKTHPGAVVATIYSDDGVTTKANPLTTDENGEFSFYAADGNYTLTVSGTGITERTIGPVTLLDTDDANDDTLLATDVSFTQSGTGATSETVQDVLRYLCQSVKSYGAVGNGSTDDTVAIQKAIDAVNAKGGGVVFFPEGTYLISAALTLPSYTNVHLVGEGWNASSISTATNSISMISITGASVRCAIKGLWLGSFTARTAVTGISVVGTSSAAPCHELLFRDVKIQNVNIPFSATDMHQSYMQNVKIMHTITSAVSGNCVHLKGVVGFWVTDVDCEATTGTFGADNFLVDRDCDTVILTNCNVVGGTTGNGFKFQNNGGSTGPRLTRASNCYAEDCSDTGFVVAAARDVRLDGCHAAVNTVYGFRVQGGSSVVISNSFALQNGSHGFYVDGGEGAGLIGCTASDNSQTTTNSADGIRVENSTTDVRIIGCRSGDFVFGTGNRQRYGISIGGTNTDYIVAKGNILTDNNTAGMGNFSTGANNDLEYEGTFTGTLTGFNGADPTGSVRFRRTGRVATLYIPLITGTSDATTCTLTGMPTDIRPARAQEFLAAITDNGTNAVGWASVATTGVITLAPTVANSASGWTNSGTKAIRLQTVTFPLE